MHIIILTKFQKNCSRGKVGSFFDITRITWLYRRHIIRSFEIQKVNDNTDWIRTSNMTKVQPLLKIRKLYLGNPVSKFVEITCRKIFRRKFKTISVYTCIYVS